ncbi:NAD(P)/FAD-dependent oxidoreductase [Hirschia baltica]|uniref:Monooxygenase FAD-binding n=1 Tax=Hirschia baltica (strain ATCC 49814 / DSM 5838 / IFAM 1418) TaxID=582402 RepID=C6XIP4_HIRBI|nr:NAD(P)/FAD-dependent oxidoreductase [Hirschia baltica]ACT58989.1 monooxygenase FAD-binding [Hirschia baltica ATCC 49814]
MQNEVCDVAIIGAGPSGAVAASILVQKGWNVKVFERQHFPRFSIGESLLPHCVEFIEQAGLLEAVEAEGFQFKDGAAFTMDGKYEDIYFPDKSSPGPGTVYQVQREKFDKILIDGAASKGTHVSFGDTVTSFEPTSETADHAELIVKNEAGESRAVRAKFVIDASGFGRVLPRLLDLEAPSDQTKRRSCFKHVTDNITHPDFDRNKILISVHQEDPQIWLWLIPLANGLSSIGVVGVNETIEKAGDTPEARLDYFVKSSGMMADFLKNAVEARPTNEIVGFSANVKNLYGDKYVLLGNAAEFLDPVFSSGVTIAMKSATLAADLIDAQLRGEEVDWQEDFEVELKRGVEAFRSCVNAWYDGLLQRMIFMENRSEDITRHFTAILAGYAWDRKNPIVKDPKRFFRLMDALTKEDA